MSILTIQNLQKNYGKIRAVNDLNLTIEEGNIYGILGPNGSGKTTTLGIVLGIIKANNGHYQWFDNRFSEKDARKRIGSLLETPNFYPYMNALQNLQIVAHIKKAPNQPYDELLQLVKLYERRHSKFSTYSLGMKQRLAIAAALIGDPDVLIFDEPTNGLDPQGIAEVRQTIKNIAERGKTIIMASHILDEVEKICSHVAIIKRGNLLADGTVASIIGGETTVEVQSTNLEKLQTLMATHPKVVRVQPQGGKLVLSIGDDTFNTAAINEFAFQNGFTLTHLVAKKKSLEAEFLEITSQN